MVDYIPIDDSEVEPEAPLSSSLGVRWRDNPVAIAQGAPGAPRVVSAGIDWSSVSGEIGQSQLKTTTGSATISLSSETVETATLPGGTHSFSVRSGATRDSLNQDGFVIGGTGTYLSEDFEPSVAHRVFVSSLDSDVGSNIFSFSNRYIQSSPPYDHGDGPVQGYDYATIDANGRVISMYLAEDPPWYGNTQNAPIEQWRDPETGKEYQRTRKLKCSKRDVDEGRISMAEFIAHAGECEDVVEEITPETKLRGMGDRPHPFEEREGRKVVLLDPMDEKIGRLIRMMQAGENVHELFNDGYLIIGNSGIKRAGPPGVPVHEIKWRKT